MAKENISPSVIRRLPRYYRFLGQLAKQGVTKISSRELSEMMRLTASQIRQDLNCFGGFGQQGYGYNIAALREEIAGILGLDICDKMILIGAGNLGRALVVNTDFTRFGYKLAGIFDSDPQLFGMEIQGVPVQNISALEDFCRAEKPAMAILCIPRTAAKQTVECLVPLGVNAFWNFTHYDIQFDHPEVSVENVHLTDSLMTLSYSAKRRSAE